jgi:hypothetical protein
LVYADDVNLLRDNMDTIRKNIDIIFHISEEGGLEITVEKTKHVAVSSPECK